MLTVNLFRINPQKAPLSKKTLINIYSSHNKEMKVKLTFQRISNWDRKLGKQSKKPEINNQINIKMSKNTEK